MNQLFLRATLLIFFFQNPYANGNVSAPPSLKDSMREFCAENPYDCKTNEIVTPHLLNTFMYEHYLKVENYFLMEGFETAVFEYCVSADCLIEGVDVKNSQYKITQSFPSRRDYYHAFGGYNESSGVHFMRSLSNIQADELCSIQIRPGNSLPTRSLIAIEENKVMRLSELRDKHYKNYSLFFVQYLPSLYSLDIPSSLPKPECWLKNRNKMWIFESTKD